MKTVNNNEQTEPKKPKKKVDLGSSSPTMISATSGPENKNKQEAELTPCLLSR